MRWLRSAKFNEKSEIFRNLLCWQDKPLENGGMDRTVTVALWNATELRTTKVVKSTFETSCHCLTLVLYCQTVR